MSNQMKWTQNSTTLTAFGRDIAVSCDVRNEINKRRLANQISYSIPNKIPYQPRIFPVGKWRIGRPRPDNDPYKAPFYVPTDAWQMVPVWIVEGGKYVKKSDRLIKDEGYGLHHSTSPTTLGCIKIMKKADLLWLVDQINKALDNKEDVILEVL